MPQLKTKNHGSRGSNIGSAGCDNGMWDGIREILKARCGMKIGRRDRDMLRFEGGIEDRTGMSP